MHIRSPPNTPIQVPVKRRHRGILVGAHRKLSLIAEGIPTVMMNSHMIQHGPKGRVFCIAFCTVKVYF